MFYKGTSLKTLGNFSESLTWVESTFLWKQTKYW